MTELAEFADIPKYYFTVTATSSDGLMRDSDTVTLEVMVAITSRE